MSALAETIAFIFGLVALGYLAGLAGLLKDDSSDALSDFATSIALPVLLFRTLSTSYFGDAAPWSLWITYFVAVAASWSLGQVVTARVFGRDRRTSIIGGIASGFSNLVVLGLPFMLGVFGQAGVSVLSLIVAVHLPIMLGVSVLLFALADKGSGRSLGHEVAQFLKALATNPLVIGIVLGLLWRFLDLTMPALGSRIIDTFAGVAGPLALFAMGLGLRRFGITANFVPGLTLSLIKLAFMPTVALGMALLLDLPPMAAKVAVVGAGLPTGVNPYLFATKFGTGQALSSNSLTIGTLLAAATTAFWLTVVEAIFG
jgi:malonate transporter and related proteins